MSNIEKLINAKVAIIYLKKEKKVHVLLNLVVLSDSFEHLIIEKYIIIYGLKRPTYLKCN